MQFAEALHHKLSFRNEVPVPLLVLWNHLLEHAIGELLSKSFYQLIVAQDLSERVDARSCFFYIQVVT